MTSDMTVGSPVRLLIKFTIPLLIGNLFQQFYNMADAVIVGRTIGPQALAAVGSTGAIAFMVFGFFFGMTSGFAVITGQRFGAKDHAGVRRSVTTSILLCVFFSISITLLSVATTTPLLQYMDTPEDIFADARSYILLLYWGISATVFYNMISGIIRALGDSRTPLIFLIIASILNIMLDYLFILVFRMGVAGAATATVLAQLVSGLLCLRYVKRHFPILHLRRHDWKFSFSFAWEHLRVAMPMAFQFSITAIGVIAMQRVLNSFGSNTIAAFTAASKIEQLTAQPMFSLGIAMATYAAQNYGAGLIDRIRNGVRGCTILSISVSLAGALMVITCGRLLVRFFLGTDLPEIEKQAQLYLNVTAAFYIVLGQIFVYRNVLQGIGRSFMPMMAGVTELVLRVVCSAFFGIWFGYIGVCFISPAAWVGATLLLSASWNHIRHRLRPPLLLHPQHH